MTTIRITILLVLVGFLAPVLHALNEKAIVKEINLVRIEAGLEPIGIIAELEELASIHLDSLYSNLEAWERFSGVTNGCSSHSWPGECCFAISGDKNVSCMTDQGMNKVGYISPTYEITHFSTAVLQVEEVVQSWLDSQSHRPVILNEDGWSMIEWGSIGAATRFQDGLSITSVWFGEIQSGEQALQYDLNETKSRAPTEEEAEPVLNKNSESLEEQLFNLLTNLVSEDASASMQPAPVEKMEFVENNELDLKSEKNLDAKNNAIGKDQCLWDNINEGSQPADIRNAMKKIRSKLSLSHMKVMKRMLADWIEESDRIEISSEMMNGSDGLSSPSRLKFVAPKQSDPLESEINFMDNLDTSDLNASWNNNN
jgi:hypothetical protein